MPILDQQRCDRCGLTHQDGPLYLCLKCAAVLCHNQLAVAVSLDDEQHHKLTNGKSCGPVVESGGRMEEGMAAMDKAEEEPDFSTISVYRDDGDGNRVVVYTVALPSRDTFCSVDIHLRSDAPGLAGGQSVVIPQLVITKGQTLEVEFRPLNNKEQK